MLENTGNIVEGGENSIFVRMENITEKKKRGRGERSR